MHGPPFVTALCLTRNRRQWLPKAIRTFQLQTYPNKELLILSDGEDVRDLVPDDARIRLVHIEEGRTIGEKRNCGAGLAGGDVIVHWDDDDWSAPKRLADQMQRLRETGKSVTGYCSMLFTDGSRWWLYDGVGNFNAMGTSLCYRKNWWRSHPFPAKQIGEDGEFVTEARQHHQLVSVPAGNLMAASIHPGNTSHRILASSPWLHVPNVEGLPEMEMWCS